VATTLSGATTVLFGVGGTPAFSPIPLTCFVTLNDPTITQVLTALSASGQWPLLYIISTTGLDAKRDLPLAMRRLHKALKVPHRNKTKIEELVVRAANEVVLAGHVFVRPVLLTDGEQIDKLRAGYRGRTKAGGNASGRDMPSVWLISRQHAGWVVVEFSAQLERDGVCSGYSAPVDVMCRYSCALVDALCFDLGLLLLIWFRHLALVNTI